MADEQVMSAEGASQLSREIQLGDDDYVLPNGQTKGELRREQRAQDRVDAREAAKRETESLRAQASDRPNLVRVAVVDGQVLASPVSSVVEEKTEASLPEGREVTTVQSVEAPTTPTRTRRAPIVEPQVEEG
ncbi:MAG TPA: hypothetical protein VGB17_02895 [Pyrinomonadaceae bacterium]|jgi:hypothetical protein